MDNGDVDSGRPIRGSIAHCSVDSCDRKHSGLGYCRVHYKRHIAGRRIDAPVRDRLSPGRELAEALERYSERDEYGCNIWTGFINADGYGRIGSQLTHRIAYELATGEKLLSFHAVHHTCAKRACIEPGHLQKVTPVENNVEMLERNWYKRRIAELEASLAEATKELSECHP